MIASINFTGTMEEWLNKSWTPGQVSYSYSLFINDVAVTNVFIPNSVTSIGNSAFSGCSSLTSVTIPNSVTSIGDYAFSGCSGLTSVTIPNSVTSIGEGAFGGVNNIIYSGTATGSPWGAKCVNGYVDGYLVYSDATKTTLLGCSAAATGEIVIPNSVTSIGIDAFSGCSGLTSVTIPNSVTSIGDGAFGGVNNIIYSGTATGSPWGAKCVNGYVDGYLVYSDATKTTLLGCSTASKGEIVIPNSVTSIGDGAFGGCSGLISIEIPNSVTSIGHNAFTLCSGLTSIEIPNSVTSIGYNAFTSCSGLTSVTIGNSVTSIGMGAFYGCKIASINFTGTMEEWCYKSWYPSEISSGYQLLMNGVLQENVIIPNSVTSIGEYAFYGCGSLTSVTLGTSVKVIEEYAFKSTAIETITCYSMRPPTVNNNAFENLDYSTIVYVPADYLNYYKVHDFWGLYDVRPIGASKTETTEVKVEPTATTADVVWPAVENAATYELVIKDKNGNVVCTLIFNANGQLTQIDFGAPARDNAAQAAGFAFTVTGLEEGTSYDLTITAKDGNGTTLDEKTIAFSTSGWTGVDALQAGELHSSKVLRNGEVLIIRGGKMYNLQGVEVK